MEFARAIIRATCRRDKKNSADSSSYVMPSMSRLCRSSLSRALWIRSVIRSSISEFVSAMYFMIVLLLLVCISILCIGMCCYPDSFAQMCMQIGCLPEKTDRALSMYLTCTRLGFDL